MIIKGSHGLKNLGGSFIDRNQFSSFYLYTPLKSKSGMKALDEVPLS